MLTRIGIGNVEPLEPRTLLSTYYLSPTGSDAAAGTLAAPWRTLAAAAARVGSGDEVVLRGGAYAGGATFNDPNLLIRAYAGERPVVASPIDDPNVGWAIRVGVDASGVTLRGLELVGGYYYCVKTETTWGWGGGTPLYGSSHLLIDACVLHGSGRDCVKVVPGAHHVTIRGCEIYDSGLRDPSNAEGIDNVNGDAMAVQECYIHDIATNGVYAKGGAADCLIERNRVVRTGGIGIALGFYTDAEFFDADNAAFYESIDSVVRNNYVAACNYAGIGLYAALRPRVYNNTLVDVANGGQSGITLAPGTVWVSDVFTAYAPNRDVQVYNNVVAVDTAAPVFRVRVVDGHSGLEGTIGIDNNLYHRAGGAASFRDDRAGGFTGSLAAWRARIGGDGASLEAAPLLDAAKPFRQTAASPGRDKGRALAGFAGDVEKQARPQGPAWDIGADEFVDAAPPPDTAAPTVELVSAPVLRSGGGTSYKFSVRYADDRELDAATFDNRDVLVTGPGGFEQLATLFRVDAPGDGPTRTVTYRLAARGGAWDASDNGVYTIVLRKLAVADTSGNTIPRTVVGTFSLRIPVTTAAFVAPPPVTPQPVAASAFEHDSVLDR